MKISELIAQIPEILEQWPGGINFKTKSRFAGFSHKAAGGVPDAMISMEMLQSDQWGTAFHILDKEFTAALFGTAAINSIKEIKRLGFNHPCRETCSGWIQGYERGRYESSEEIEFLKKICLSFAAASKNKHTLLIVESLGHHYDPTAERATVSKEQP